MSADIDQRLARLERQNRYLQFLFVISFLFGASTLAFLLTERRGKAEGVISARGFEVVDGQGRKRATFGLTEKDEPMLALNSSDNDKTALISIRPEGPPFIVLTDVKTYGSLSLYGPGGDWSAGIHLTSDAKQLGEMFVSKDGVPSLTLRDKEGKTLWKAP